jgi:hypothetical protein
VSQGVAPTASRGSFYTGRGQSGKGSTTLRELHCELGTGRTTETVRRSQTNVAAFTRSGVTTIAAGTASVVASVPGGLTAASHVLATIQGAPAGAISVKSVAPTTATGKITIYLTEDAPAGGITVAWFVLGEVVAVECCLQPRH